MQRWWWERRLLWRKLLYISRQREELYIYLVRHSAVDRFICFCPILRSPDPHIFGDWHRRFAAILVSLCRWDWPVMPAILFCVPALLIFHRFSRLEIHLWHWYLASEENWRGSKYELERVLCRSEMNMLVKDAQLIRLLLEYRLLPVLYFWFFIKSHLIPFHHPILLKPGWVKIGVSYLMRWFFPEEAWAPWSIAGHLEYSFHLTGHRKAWPRSILSKSTLSAKPDWQPRLY